MSSRARRYCGSLQPTAGQPGEDIFGNAIGCQPGKAVTARKGKNVETTPDGNEFFAQLPGMLEVVGDAVSIEPALIIQGDVDMSIGNINFIGPVKVAKDVRDDFKIRAGKGSRDRRHGRVRRDSLRLVDKDAGRRGRQGQGQDSVQGRA